MKPFIPKRFTLAVAILACVAGATSIAQTMPTRPPPGDGLQPAPAASFPTLKRADLTPQPAGPQFLFSIRNVGTDDAPLTTTTITCKAYTAPPGQGTYVPCVEGTHYVIVSSPASPPGTVKSSSTWKVPPPALAASTGEFKFTLNIKPSPAQWRRGLNFDICADSNSAVSELNEGNNCLGFNQTWP